MSEPSRRQTPSLETLLGGLSLTEFLADYWQQKPLFVKGGWPGFGAPISPDQLAGLACEEGPCARIVREHGDSPWELRRGPFSETDFTELPSSHWTLLVSDVEKWLPALRSMLEPFRFIPDWRIDDLMVSYAAPSGSVGPHVDQYDVFLLQGMGRRRWQISNTTVDPENRVVESELHILKHFEAQQEWTAETGDLLYLPPGIAHYGVAIDDCMTFSIGFRAPSERDLILSLLDYLGTRIEPGGRYQDPRLSPQASPAWITADAIDRVESILRRLLQIDRPTIYRWFGRLVTEPKAELVDLLADNRERDLSGFRATLMRYGAIDRSGASRLALASVDQRLLIFVDGDDFELPRDLAAAAQVLCQDYRYTATELDPLLERHEFASLVMQLYRAGTLYFSNE